MNNTLKSARLDFFTVLPYATLKNFGILVLLSLFLENMVSFAIAFMSMMFLSYPFAVGEQNGIDQLYATLPISRKNVVAGRYIFGGLLNILMCAVGVVMISVSALIRKSGYEVFIVGVISCLATVGVMMILQNLQYPVYFKHGYLSARKFVFLPFIFIAFLPQLIPLIGKKIAMPTWVKSFGVFLGSNPWVIVISAILIIILSYVISYFLSVKYYNKRDF